MISSPADHESRRSAASPEKTGGNFSSTSLQSTVAACTTVTPATMDDSGMVRQVVTDAMRNCTLSRAEIADRMSYLTGTSVTERMLNNFAAASRDDYRFPAALERAFCSATGDTRLLTCRAEAAGLRFVDQSSLDLMELGREFLRQKRAAAKMAALEVRLQGVSL